MTKPIRIQRKRTRGWKMPEDAIYVGRPTKCGKTLACFCALDQPCHADVLLELANA